LVNTNPANKFNLVAVYNKDEKTFAIHDDTPDWFKNDLYPYLQQQQGLTNFEHPYLRPFDRDDNDDDIGISEGYTH